MDWTRRPVVSRKSLAICTVYDTADAHNYKHQIVMGFSSTSNYKKNSKIKFDFEWFKHFVKAY